MLDRSARSGNGSPTNLREYADIPAAGPWPRAAIRAGHQFALTTLFPGRDLFGKSGSQMRFAVQIAALLLSPLALPAAAQQTASATMTPAVPLLKAGQFRWLEEPALIKASTGPSARVRIVVSINQQQALVYRGDTLVGITTVSTGSPGRDTPVGEFTILEKKVFHRSNLYSDAPMPYMQRLTWDGIALHAGHLPGYPSSHGCIRLPAAFARQLFDLTEMVGTVQVIDDFLELPLYTPMPVAEPTPSPLLAAEMRGLGGDSYNVVTMAGDPPAQAERAQPASWVAGPYKEIVQPTGRGSR